MITKIGAWIASLGRRTSSRTRTRASGRASTRTGEGGGWFNVTPLFRPPQPRRRSGSYVSRVRGAFGRRPFAYLETQEAREAIRRGKDLQKQREVQAVE